MPKRKPNPDAVRALVELACEAAKDIESFAQFLEGRDEPVDTIPMRKLAADIREAAVTALGRAGR